MRTFYKTIAAAIMLSSAVMSTSSFAEGTKELRPASTDRGYLLLGTSWSPFATYFCDTSYRLHIEVCNVGEVVHIGLRVNSSSTWFRVKDPTGADVIAHRAVPTSGQAGYCNNFNEAVAGPQALVGGSGYNSLTFVAGMTGSYYIEFNMKNSATSLQKRTRRVYDWDITVADPTNTTAIPGRVWTREWAFTCDSYFKPFRGELYMYSDDNIVTSIKFNDIKPFYFTITANQTGTAVSADPYDDRKSKAGNKNYPQYKIFLNDPDSTCHPTGIYGNVTGPITVTGCDPDARCINVPVDKAGNVDLILDLNGIPNYDPGTVDRILNANVVPGTNCILWDSRDGLGNLVAAGTPMPVEVHYFNGITHLPLYDVENHELGYVVELHRPNTGLRPRMFWDDTDFTSGTLELGGCSDSTGCHDWPFDDFSSTVGCCSFGNGRTINSWWYANIITASTVYNVETIFVDANTDLPDDGSGASQNDTTVCSNEASFQLAGSVTGSTTTGQWTVINGGNGTFDDDTDLVGTYTFGSNDYTAGQVTLVLTSTNNGACPSVSDTMTITIAPGPTVDAGPNQSKCDNNPVTTLAGVVTVATGGTWTGGAGGFAPDADNLTAVYTPDAAEITAGTVTLTLTTTGNGVCNPSSDSMTITFSGAPTVSAGPDDTICENNSTATLAGSFTGSTGIQWSGGAGNFSNSTITTSTYTPNAAEISAGSAELIITTTGNGGCLAVTDTMNLVIDPTPTADAGINQIVCANNADVTMAGAVTNATGGVWTTSGDGTFDDSSSMTAVYTPGTGDVGAGTVTLTLSTTGINNCIVVTDDMTVTITASPDANAGADKIVCANNADVSLAGATVTNATGGTWIGAGTFTPSVNDLSATYTPTAGEIGAGLAQIVLQTTGNGNCVAEDDTVLVLIQAAPTVDAGVDQTSCENNPAITTAGTSSSGVFSWSSSSGAFGNVNDLITTFTPSATQVSAGTATITLTASQAGCLDVTDDMIITFSPSPVANAGPDQELCANNADATMGGSVIGSTGGVWSSTGTGTFDDTTSLTATYTPSVADTSSDPIFLILTTTGNGGCNAEDDTMQITFTPIPTANAGADSTVCGNNAEVNLSGSVTIATGGSWSGGGGTYNPDANNLNTSYTPSAAEVTAGTVTLTLSTTGNGNCNAETDQMTITITPAPTVDAGVDQSICANNPLTTLGGSITVASGATWTGGAGTFSDNTSLTSTYLPTAAEITAGTVTLTLTTTGNGDCNAVSDDMIITITPAPTIDAGPDQTVCGDLAAVNLNASTTVATGGTWVTTGAGVIGDANALVTTYTPDATDTIPKLVRMTITSTGNGNCAAVTDEMEITLTTVPVIDAGPDDTVCTNALPAQLAASGSPATWTTSGTGTFDNANLLNAVYTPSDADTNAGSVTLTITTIPAGACATVNDNMTLTIPAGPRGLAGPDQSVCADALNITLAGSSANATGIVWTTSGTGTFSSNTDPTGTYTFSADDTAAGTVSLVLTTTNADGCNNDVDSMDLTITPAPTALAGLDKTACADVDSIALNGTVYIASGATWSGGAGTFSPDANTLEAYYIPAAADTVGGGPITLTLTSTGNGGCNAVNDQVDITFTPAPSVEAGANVTVCADTASVAISGTVTIASGGQWTSNGSGVFSPNNTTLNTAYVPSAADTAAGSVTLTLQTTGSGTCKDITDSMVITIDPVPFVDAGSDMIICGDSASVGLSGNVQNATGGQWTTTGDGNFSLDTDLNATYNIGTNDSTGGTVTLILTSTGSGSCADVTDNVVITITDPPTIDAGPDQTVCAINSGVNLGASVTVSSGIVWTTSGDGTFDDSTSLTAVYTLSNNDTTAGSVTLTATSTGNGNCNAVTDNNTITITSVPVVSAGADVTVCGDSTFIAVSGSISGGVNGLWSSTGTGTFFPSPASLAANYVPSAADVTAGTVTLVLSTDGAAPCTEVTDSMTVTFTDIPTVEAGPDQNICADNSTVNLAGAVTIATGGEWLTSGTGTFNPNNTDLNASYTPSTLDTAAGTVIFTLRTTGNGDCKEYTDFFTLTIDPAPFVNTNGDQAICADQNTIDMGGTVQIAGGATWTSTGSGTFNPNANTASATYTPSAADQTAGSVTLVMTTTNNVLCNAVTDTVNLTIAPVPVIDAGSDLEVCGDGSGVTLGGSITNAGGLEWSSSGTGVFSPSITDPSALYTPSADDITAGSVVLTVESTGNGTCIPVSDSMTLTVTSLPTVSAGTDITICNDDDFVLMSGSHSNADSVLWTSSGSGSFDVDSAVGAAYTLSDPDRALTSITNTYTAYGSGSCPDVSDIMILTIDVAPTGNAGPDLVVCDQDTTVELIGSAINHSGARWLTAGTGTFIPANDSTIVTYRFSNADTAAGSVVFEFLAEGVGSCGTDTDSMTVTFSAAQTIDAGGPNQTVCGDTSGIALNGSGSNGVWSGGAGTFSPDSTALNATYKPTAGELGVGTLQLILTTTSNGSCPAAVDTLNLTFVDAPTLDGGSDITVCGDTSGITLGAAFTNATGLAWTASGTGAFDDTTSLTPTYVPSAKDISDSIVFINVFTTGSNAPCPELTDEITLYITPPPTSNAGLDQSVCADKDTVQLTGAFTIAGAAGWTTAAGTGTFTDTSNMNASYVPSAGDKTGGSVQIFLTTLQNGDCQAKVDTMDLTITPAPTVNAGADDTICSNSLTYSLNASVTVANNASWTTNGAGTFSPTSADSSVNYNVQTADTSGIVQFIVTTTGNGTCQAVSDTINLAFDPVPTAAADTDQVLCKNTSGAVLNGSTTISSTGGWVSAGTGTFNPDTATLNATYIPSQQDLDNGAVTLTLFTTDNESCSPASDAMVLNFTAAPTATVNAGFDQTLCEDANDVDLLGAVTIALGGTWRTQGDGTFDDSTDLDASYFPSTNDKTAGNVSLILESTDNGICEPVRDTMTITFTPIPTVDAGSDETRCADVGSVTLSGAVTIATGGIWTSSGSGIFAPSTSTLGADYFPSAADKAAGAVGLTLTTTGNGTCQAYNDFMSINFTPIPTVDAGIDQTICADNDNVFHGGAVTVATGGLWTTSGSGTFDDSTNLFATYIATANDDLAGIVNFTLTTTGNGLCNPVDDDMVVTITPAPTVNAGVDQTVCANNSNVSLNGSITVASGATWSGGTGTFSPNANTLNAVYTPSESEITAGTVNLTLTTTGNGLCNAVQDQMAITITPAPTVTAGDEKICADFLGGQLHGDFTVSTGVLWTSSGTGVFSPSAADTGAFYTPSAADIAAGQVTLTITSDGNGSCIAVSDDILMLIKALPIADAGADQTICRNNTVSLSAASFSNLTYAWTNFATTAIGTGTSIDIANISADTSFILTVTDETNCQTIDTIAVFVTDPPTLNLPVTDCFYDTTTLDAAPVPAANPGTFQWYFNGALLDGETGTTHTPTDQGQHVVSYNFEGCTVFDTLNTHQPLFMNGISTDLCLRDANPEAVLDAGSGTNYTYQWEDDLGTPLGTGQTLVVNDIGWYFVDITEGNTGNSCQNRDSILVISICAPDLFIPTAFIPGSGGNCNVKCDAGCQNGCFYVNGLDFTNYELRIFNRWGEVVFQSNDVNQSWDGTFRGEVVPQGVYPWIVTFEGITDEFKGPFQKRGAVSVVR